MKGVSRRREEIVWLLSLCTPSPLSLSLWAEMMYGCKGHMLAVWWIKALCRKITESASAHRSLALNKTLFNIEMEREGGKRERDKEDNSRWLARAESGGRSLQTHSYTRLLWVVWKHGEIHVASPLDAAMFCCYLHQGFYMFPWECWFVCLTLSRIREKKHPDFHSWWRGGAWAKEEPVQCWRRTRHFY